MDFSFDKFRPSHLCCLSEPATLCVSQRDTKNYNVIKTNFTPKYKAFFNESVQSIWNNWLQTNNSFGCTTQQVLCLSLLSFHPLLLHKKPTLQGIWGLCTRASWGNAGINCTGQQGFMAVHSCTKTWTNPRGDCKYRCIRKCKCNSNVKEIVYICVLIFWPSATNDVHQIVAPP